MSDNLYLFANNNEGTAEDLGYYRLYNMEIEGDSEGVDSGVDYVDFLIGDGASYIDTGMAIPSGYKVEVTFMSTVQKAEYISNDWCAIFGCSNAIGFTYDTIPYGISVGLYSTNISIKNNGQTNLQYANINATCYNKKYILSLVAGENNTNPGNILVFANNNLKQSGQINPYPFAHNYLRIYDFKIYNAQGDLIQHLKPCLDEEGIPCMYDEVSKQYFYNQGTGTFGYKKKLRDFQPVLDSNGIPCLMDKVDKKYYYDKNGKGFSCDRYSGVSYLKGDGNSWIDTGLIANQMHGYRIETKIINKSANSENTILFGSSQGGFDNANANCHLRYNYYGYPQGLTFIDDDGTGQCWTMKVNEIYSFVMTVNQPTSSNSFYLCAGNQRDSAIGVCDCGIYYWKVYDTNNNLIQHLIPAIDTDGSIGMYDLVTETFFYNQGTGTFSYGIEEDECPKVANAIDCINKINRDNNDYFRTKNFNGLINENLIIKTKIALGSLRDNNGVYFQIVGQYNMNRLYLGYKTTNNQLEYAFFGANDSVTLTDYDVFNDEVWEIELSKNGLTVNGVFIKSLESDITGTSLVVPLYIFQSCSYQDKTNGNVLPGQKIYELIFEQDGQIIANFQPCLDDNENLCFCDIVDNTYYYPTLGTSYGYNQLLQTPIKYIETNGTQYIDTGVVINDNTYIDIDYRAIDKPYFQVGWKNSVDLFPNPNVEYILETDIKYLGQQQGSGVVIQTHSWSNFLGITAEGYYSIYDTVSTTLASTTSYDKIKIKITNSAILLYINDELTLEVANSSVFGAILEGGSSNWALFRTHGVKATSLDGEVLYNCIPVLADTDITLSGKTSTLEGLPRIYEEINGTYTKIHYPDNLNYQEHTGRPNWDYGYDDSYLCNNMTLINTYKQVQYADANSDTKSFTIYDKSVYGYKETNTTVEPNLTASEGATLTLGSTYMSYLSEEELEQATKNGWIIE